MNIAIKRGDIETSYHIWNRGFPINNPVNTLQMTSICCVCSLRVDMNDSDWQETIK